MPHGRKKKKLSGSTSSPPTPQKKFKLIPKPHHTTNASTSSTVPTATRVKEEEDSSTYEVSPEFQQLEELVLAAEAFDRVDGERDRQVLGYVKLQDSGKESAHRLWSKRSSVEKVALQTDIDIFDAVRAVDRDAHAQAKEGMVIEYASLIAPPPHGYTVKLSGGTLNSTSTSYLDVRGVQNQWQVRRVVGVFFFFLFSFFSPFVVFLLFLSLPLCLSVCGCLSVSPNTSIYI